MSEYALNRRRMDQENVIYTVTANCQDCYRCVRVCPVKAIRVKEGQAYIEDDLCIKCGTCIRECPQGAKTIRSSVEKVKRLLSSEKKVAVSVAPSFPALFSGWRSFRLPSALRLLGFDYISETAEGAQMVADKAFEIKNEGGICTACPAVINYIEKYRPEHVEELMPIVSPMIAHGRYLKNKLGDGWAVVFIGPCAAKKDEAMRPEHEGVIDAVLTFTELIDWMQEEQIDLSTCTESGFESQGDLRLARLFPLEGGMLKAGHVSYDGTDADVLCVSGNEDVIELLSIPSKEWGYKVVEPLFCSGGCINGPCLQEKKNYFLRKQELLKYSSKEPLGINRDIKNEIDCNTGFEDDSDTISLQDVSEERINEILAETGKGNPELQLNCGACGYKSCRENAIAIARGMAEPDMCMPYMRRLAQQRTDIIIETSPNGIVVLDDHLHIIHMNPAFRKLFSCNNSILGRHISCILDADSFEHLAMDHTATRDSIRVKDTIKYHEIVYALVEEKQYVGIYIDVSNLKLDEAEVDTFKDQTLEHVRKLLYHQINFSQEMAHYLGKSTAESEELVKRIAKLYEEEKPL
ncbi:MAG TPA: [Fe-Fe] hydrogenase large subunit C-terminal domain-containing protein [Anaerovoracaceae bacterium]|nr:[Fe-Fe] hydrogenase large subunit C-terminal domain-containing protein [Anaerovoracaceae bacterium]